MGIKVYVLNSSRRVKAILNMAIFDMELGSGSKNDFELSFNDTLPEDSQVTLGDYWTIPDTDIGGIIESIQDAENTVTYKGRVFAGILDNKIIEPDSGNDYYTQSGNLRSIVATLLNRYGLTSLFTVDSEMPNDYISKYQYNRYVSVYAGLQGLFKTKGYTLFLSFSVDDYTVHVNALPVQKVSHVLAGATLDAQLDTRPVNHLIGLGKGELRNRLVVHWYADANGNVSQSQTFTGLNERTEVYEQTSEEDRAKLDEATREKLEEYQTFTTAKLTISNSNLALNVGDIVTATSPILGIIVSAPIDKKIIQLEKDTLASSFTLTDKTTTTNY